MPEPERDPVTHLLKVFIAYPGDCTNEVAAVLALITAFNADDAREFGVRLIPWEWKGNLHPAVGDPQKLADAHLDQAHVVVALFKHKPGAPTPDADGGTVHEFFRTYERCLAEPNPSKHPALLTYFSTEPLSEKDNDDEEALARKQALAKFRKRVEAERIATFDRFANAVDLKEKVRKHLREVVRTAAAPRNDSTANETRNPPAASPAISPHFDLARYADYVRERCGYIHMRGKVARARSNRPVEIADAYIPLLVSRPRLERNQSHADDARREVVAEQILQALREPQGTDALDLSKLIADGLRSEGAPETEFADDSGVAACLARIQALPNGPRDAEEIRHHLRSVPVDVLKSSAFHLLIEGPPGCGKTTILRHFADALIRAHVAAAASGPPAVDRPIPVFIPLGALRSWLSDPSLRTGPRSSDRLLAYLRDHVETFGGAPGWLEPLLLDGRCWVLFDGLDEIPEPEIQEEVVSIVCDFVARFRRCRFALTSRPGGLSQTRVAKLEGCRFAYVVVRDFDRAQIRDFVSRWYDLVPGIDAPSAVGDFMMRVERREAVLDLARRPIMLTTMTVVHQDKGKLPERRATLYEECVETLCADLDEQKNQQGYGVVWQGRLDGDGRVRFLQNGADKLQTREAGKDTRVLEQSELLELVRDALQEAEAPSDDRACRGELRSVVERTGLLIPEGEYDCRFLHLELQQFLAARKLCSNFGNPAAQLLPHLQERWWREVIALAAGHLAKDGGAKPLELLADCFAAAKKLPDGEQQAIAYATIAHSVRDLRQFPVKSKLAASLAPHHAKILHVLSRKMVPEELKDRIAIADMLGYFDDPRLTEDRRWIEVPAGPVWIGEADPQQAWSWSPEIGAAPVPVDHFEMQRWPVTVAEFAAFIAAGGYADEDLWIESEARTWLKKSKAVEPAGWAAQSDGPGNRPVAGVSVYEAEAYCRWLNRRNARKGTLIRLPTNVEWEKAARGGLTLADGGLNPSPKRAYAWGDEFGRSYANTLTTELKGTTPTGVFSGFHSPYDIWDLTGNIWEWTPSLDGPGNSADRRPSARGGGFWSGAQDARISFRDGADPGGRYSNLGFRPVRVAVE